MPVRRIVPNLIVRDVNATRDFYTSVLGLEVVMDLEWITTLAAPGEPTTQLSLLVTDQPDPLAPAVSIEVDDVDATHAEAQRLGHDIVYPLTDEAWGVRRFFLRDPAGHIINILSHT